MRLVINGKAPTIGGRVLVKENDAEIVFNVGVVGSYFPARDAVNGSAVFSLRSQDNIDNKVYINYNDGTGEHVYNFKASGSQRRITFGTNANTTDPALITTPSTFNQTPLHFYQDLPDGVKNTVNDFYGSTRIITIRFEKPQYITEVTFNRVRLYGSLPGAFSKLSNLSTLSVNAAYYITSFPQDFYNTQVKTLILSFVGDVMNNGFPDWVLNSPLLYLTLTDSINLSGSPITKKFSEINKLKNSLLELSLSGANIDYIIPNQFNELYKLRYFTASNNTSPTFGFPADISGMIALATLDVNRTRLPLSEYERLIQSLPSLRYFNMQNITNATVDYNFTNTNNYLETLVVGGNTWGGSVPTFINKLLALKVLELRGIQSGLVTNSFTSWGNFSNCTQLTSIIMPRVTTMPSTLPVWFSGLIKLKTITAPAVYGTIARVNAFVDSIYSLVTANAPITGTAASTFRSMAIDIYGSTTIDTTNSIRPSGTYQAPSGYIAGSNNGTPASQMEKIWILVNQYSHTWTVKP